MSNPVIPSSWVYASRQFNMHSDALSENIAVYRPLKETYDSRAPANPIKLVIDSDSSFLRPQRSYLSATITCYNQDGSVNTTANVSNIGAMGVFRTMNVKIGGKVTDNVEDFPTFVMDSYHASTVAQKKYLAYNEGVGDPTIFHNSDGKFVVKHHLMAGSLRPTNGQNLPLCVLPNQAIEVTLTLNSPQNAFTNAAAGSYFMVSNVRYVAQLVTPNSAYLSSLWSGIQSGKFLELDFTGVTQIQSTCSGSSQNNFLLPLANSRVIGMTHRFRKDSAYTTPTGDKSQIYDSAGLKQWRYQIGQYRLPLTEDFQVEDTIMIRDMSLNDANSYQNEDIDLDDFYSKNYMMAYSWRSGDEDENSSLNLIGSDGNVRLITIHDTNNVPSTDVSLLTTVYTERTLLIGNTVDVI